MSAATGAGGGRIGMDDAPQRKRSVVGYLSWTVGLATVVWVSSVLGQTSPSNPPAVPALPVAPPAASAEGSDMLSADELAARLEMVQGTTELEEAVKARVVDYYQQAQATLKTVAPYQARIEELDARMKEALAPATPEVTAVLEEPNSSDLSLAQLDKWVKQCGVQLEEARTRLTKLADESEQRSARRVEIPRLIGAATERLGEIERQMTTPPDANEHALAVAARRTLLATQRHALQKSLEALRKELAYYDSSSDWLLKRRADVQREVDQLDELLKKWVKIVNERREEDVAYQVEVAQNRVKDVSTVLVALAQRNLELAQQRHQVDTQLRAARFAADEISREYETWNKEVTRIKKEIGTRTEVTDAIGLKLREQRAKLPDKGQITSDSKQRLRLINDVRSKKFAMEAEQAELLNLERAVMSWTKANIPDSAEMPTVYRLFEARRDSVDKLLVDYDALFDVLVQTDGTEHQLLELTENFRAFVDEHVLWIRSGENVLRTDWSFLRSAAQSWVSPAPWRELGSAAFAELQREAWLPLLAGLAMLVLHFAGRRGRRKLTELGERARSRSCREFHITLKALLLTLSVSAFWPGVLLFLAWWLNGLITEATLARPLAAGLGAAAAALFPLEVLRQLARPYGLGEAHFDLGTHAVAIARHSLRHLSLVFVPLVGFYAAIGQQGNSDWETTLGRLVLLALFVVVTVFTHQILHPMRGAIRDYIAYNSTSWVNRLRRVWFPMIHITALTLMLLVVVGYQYTAEHLSRRLHWSLLLVTTLWLAGALFRRWVLVSRRRLAMQQARERLASARANDPGTATSTAPSSSESSDIDLAQADLQTRRLINGLSILGAVVALWLIWVDVLPALSRLDSWTFGSIALQGSPTTLLESADGESSAPLAGKMIHVSLADVILALLVFGTALIATANIPGLIELALLQNLPLDQALRFAITTVTRYVIFLIGVVWSLSTLGVTWSSIQWLVAAISVGLGFGLQEIFANFISGLIILFEQPLRAGDIVTVGDVSGKVVNIRMRATTVEDWDGKELIVPNKDFITGRLLNWTLTDTINRITLKVSLRYGANIEEARAIIWEALVTHPNVLREPRPSVTFDLFGDNGLQLTIRAFLPNLDCRLDTIHELHGRFYEQLTSAGYEIPFPQRDLHVHWNEGPNQPPKAGPMNGQRVYLGPVPSAKAPD